MDTDTLQQVLSFDNQPVYLVNILPNMAIKNDK
jgi:hypothetical protein